MSHDAFEDRRKALEEQFFAQHEEALLKKLREQTRRAATREELRHLTGITSEPVLDALAALQVPGGAAVLVMSVYPLVEVAWADGPPDERERHAILQQAQALGLTAGTPGHEYLDTWLQEKPELSWHALWEGYVKELVKRLSKEDASLLKASVLGRARVVAEASGGFLGFAWRVSEGEARVLEKLEKAFA